MPDVPRPSALTAARLDAERDLQESVYASFGLREALESVPDRAALAQDKEFRELRAKKAHVTRGMAPGLFKVLDGVREALEFEAPVELLVDADEGINAFAFPRPLDSDLCVLAVTSGAVKQLSTDELACVMGHELGHVAYGHAELGRDVSLVYREDPQPELLGSRLRILNRLQELSADRAGALAVGRDLMITARTELKVATGLGPEHVQLDLDAYVAGIDRLEEFAIPERLFDASHPLLPIRMRALQLFCQGQEEDEPILELVRLMDFEASTPASRHTRDLLLSGGLLAAHLEAEDELSDDQRAHLVQLILPFTDDPEREFSRVDDIDGAAALFQRSAAWLRANAGPERYEHVEKLLEVTLHDGHVSADERDFLLQAADLLDIPENWLLRRLEEHEEDQARSVAPPRHFGLRQA